MAEYSGIFTWVCVFPGKLGICWKLAHDGVFTKEGAEEMAARNCNVVAVPLDLWQRMDEYQRRTVLAERKLLEMTGLRMDYKDGEATFVQVRKPQ